MQSRNRETGKNANARKTESWERALGVAPASNSPKQETVHSSFALSSLSRFRDESLLRLGRLVLGLLAYIR